MAINLFDYTAWINEPWFRENQLAVFTAITIIVLWFVIWFVWKIVKYMDGRKVREYHSNGPLDKMIERRIEELAARKR